MKNIKYLFLSVILMGFTACSDDDYDYTPDPEPIPAFTVGSLDLSKYVSVGASFTAGFTDGALFIAGQQNSFPKILNDQFMNANGGDFTQPLMNDNIGGLVFGGNIILDDLGENAFAPRLYANLSGPRPSPVRVNAASTTEATTNIFGTQGPFNNMGVPGAKSFHITLNGYGAFNPYFGRMASSPTASMLGDALVQNPTFFTLSEVGGNDVLSYATTGGRGVDQTGNFNPATYGSDDITDPNVFAQVFNAQVTALTANGAKGVVANVPYITNLPHFTTVPYNPLSPIDPAFGPQIPLLNATFAPLNQAFAFLGMPERQIVFSTTAASPVVIFDETLPNIAAQLNAVLQGGGVDPLTAGLLANQYAQSRQATPADLLVLRVASRIGQVNVQYFTQLVNAGVPAATAGQLSVNGVTYPLRDRWVLLPSEQLAIKTATDAYNVTIEAAAVANGLALVDFKGILQEASTTGVSDGNFTFTTNLISGGLVSLDGIHLTTRGYAVLANKILAAMDATYGSNFIAAGVKADPGNYPTNYSEGFR
jgi:hypothetical protein